jgi:formamidopyrimidine-DNA glycosylase
MPELPEITVYVEALGSRLAGQVARRIAVISPFLLRTVEPPPDAVVGRPVAGVSRIGKRVVLQFAGELYCVIHLMIAGRFRWIEADGRPPAKLTLATLLFDGGMLAVTEAGRKRRAALHIVAGRKALAALDPGGIDPLTCDGDSFVEVLRRGNHTLKRVLTDPRYFSGIGNAYSDEILHAARLSPVILTSRMTDDQAACLHAAARSTLTRWIDELRREFAGRFPGPGEITAFRPGFAVHGRFGRPCPVCGTPVQRIRYAENETNYCPRCQTDGRMLADRSLSRLLKDDWPRRIDDLER